jgi:hypothetical protein
MTRVFAAHRPDTIAIADRVISLSRSGAITTDNSVLKKFGVQEEAKV